MRHPVYYINASDDDDDLAFLKVKVIERNNEAAQDAQWELNQDHKRLLRFGKSKSLKPVSPVGLPSPTRKRRTRMSATFLAAWAFMTSKSRKC
mmetsp:Transcript_52243/g.89879  ORF Transcript_52243/g.89879 Transcript_52243/m.89879 type:complete len:93 (+) Transcript_52243:127-405(+)